MNNKKTGRFLGIPYDYRSLTRERLRERWWNPDEQRIIRPNAYGWGYDLNLHALLRRLQLVH